MKVVTSKVYLIRNRPRLRSIQPNPAGSSQPAPYFKEGFCPITQRFRSEIVNKGAKASNIFLGLDKPISIPPSKSFDLQRNIEESPSMSVASYFYDFS